MVMASPFKRESILNFKKSIVFYGIKRLVYLCVFQPPLSWHFNYPKTGKNRFEINPDYQLKINEKNIVTLQPEIEPARDSERQTSAKRGKPARASERQN